MTKYRRKVPTDQILTFGEHTMRASCADVHGEPVEFNGEADYQYLLVQRLNRRTAYAVRPEFTGARVRARMCGHLWSLSHFAVSCRSAPLSIIKQYIDGQARPL